MHSEVNELPPSLKRLAFTILARGGRWHNIAQVGVGERGFFSALLFKVFFSYNADFFPLCIRQFSDD